jgi:hypothetical protein
MLTERLVALIEEHADPLTARLVRKVHADPRTTGYRRFDDAELGKRAHDVYAHLGRWLEQSSDSRVADEYFPLGELRHAEGVPLAEVVMALILTRHNLWQFLESQGGYTSLELRQQMDVELLVLRFFDRAIYHAVRGYESAARGAS